MVRPRVKPCNINAVYWYPNRMWQESEEMSDLQGNSDGKEGHDPPS